VAVRERGGDSVFPPDAVIRRVDGEAAMLFGAGRALLLQLAHPMVAKGVVEHSNFEDEPRRRLQATLNASWAVVFGTRAQAEHVTRTMHRAHARVVGDGYRALDPALLLWVHATIVDTALAVYTMFVERLSPAEEAEYYAQAVEVAELLGCPRHHQPADLAAFRAYTRDMVCTLEVTDDARRAARAVLHPRLLAAGVPVSWVAEPALALTRFVTVGMLPRPIRSQYGFGWDGRRDAALRIGVEVARRAIGVMPPVVRRVA
jgi:uncharacterized protein (DUF2236 family)